MACQQEYAERNSTKEATLRHAPCRCLESRFGKAGLAKGKEIVGPVVSVLVSRDLGAALPCCRWRAAPPMLSPGRDLHPEAPQSCVWTLVQITPVHMGRGKSSERRLIVVTFPFRHELYPSPARLTLPTTSAEGLVPPHGPCLGSPSPRARRHHAPPPAAGTGACFGRERSCAAGAAV